MIKPIQRQRLFEFEDQRWLPAFLRNYLTELLQYQIVAADIYLPVLPHLAHLMKTTGQTEIIDLCSGSGGAMVQLAERLRARGYPLRVTLTDLYPNKHTCAALSQRADSGITYHTAPIHALQVPAHWPGILTIFTGFHHFSPIAAIQLLQNAVDQGRPIAIFEFTQRTRSNLLGMLLSPFAVWLQTAQLRPVCWSRFFWTYLLPVVPLIYWWDGTISHWRTYTQAELHALVHQVKTTATYQWEIGHTATNPPITYLIGISLRGETANSLQHPRC